MTAPATGSPASEGGEGTGTTPTGNEFTPITTQEDLNKVIGERIKRVESKFADYSDLQARAAKLAEIEDAQKTAEQKAAERIAALEAKAAAAETAALRSKVQATYKIDNDDAELFLTGTTAEQLEAQAKRLAERQANANAAGPRPDLTQGAGSGGGQATPAQEFGAFMEKQLSR